MECLAGTICRVTREKSQPADFTLLLKPRGTLVGVRRVPTFNPYLLLLVSLVVWSVGGSPKMTDPDGAGGEGLAEVNTCSLEIERKYEVIPAVICSMCCLFGIIYCFIGYRCFKAVMFLSGLMFGSVIIFLLCHKERVLDTQLSVEASAGIGLGIGLLCGLVTMLVRSVGLFMTGLLLGLLLALATLLVTHQFYTPTTVWVPLGVLLGTGMLFAVLTLQWQKLFTVLSTSVFGAAIMTVCADYFVEMLALASHAYECLRLSPAPSLCWYSWVIMGIWPALSFMGVLVQWKLTAEGFSHTEGKHHRITYRSNSYLQSLRDRQMCTGNSLSSLGTTNHTMIDFDYETSSTVPLTATTPVNRV
ncbi:unnamed protein product [Coregonus sp. 'balchen']|nr:unnamed protein product [Coregonus sp. 'balchen']